MSAWRVIITDTESMTGVAPVCREQDNPEKHGNDEGRALPEWVFDCCPHPHVEMWDEAQAAQLAETLTSIDAELCS